VSGFEFLEVNRTHDSHWYEIKFITSVLNWLCLLWYSCWRPLLWSGRYSEQFRRIGACAWTTTYTTDTRCPCKFRSW